jgi:phage tail sheath gpL-like
MSVDLTAVARVVGIDTHFRDLRGGAVQFLPQHIGIVGQGNTASVGYALTPYRITSAAMASARYGFGSQIHLAALELFPVTGGGVGSIPVTVFPMVDAVGSAAAVGSITPSGTATVVATYRVRVAGILSAPFTTAVGDTVALIVAKIVAALVAILEMPLTAANGTTKVDVTAKCKGDGGNDIAVEVLDNAGEIPVSGLTFTIVQPAAGATDPDLSSALAQIGGLWVTLLINCLGPSNTVALNDLSDVGEGRWGQLIRRPFVAFTGNYEPVVATATTITNARTTDRVNCQLVSPGSVHLPLQIAAAQVREIAKVANNNPPTDYGSRLVRGLVPGPDGVQWDYAQRDQAVKAGSSTVEIKNGLVNISDVVTMYKPTGEIPPAYRYVVDIIKLMTIIYNFDLEFSNPAWDGAPLIPDGQATANPNARKPSGAKAAVCKILDSLGLEAIISDPKTAKQNTFASINSQNPKRLDISTTVQLSGNTNIISADLFFGFFFGTPTLVG